MSHKVMCVKLGKEAAGCAAEDMTSGERAIFHWLEFATVMIFTAEYLLRIFVASNRLKFIFSFFGIIGLLAILPFYLVAGLDLRTVRLLRVLKLMRYSKAMPLFHRAFLVVKQELLLFLFISGILFYLSGVGIYYFEKTAQPELFASVFHSLWCALITLTTVGYGDVVPITIGGRCFTFLVLMLGIGVVAIPTGLIASALTKVRDNGKVENNTDNTKC